MFEKNKPLCAIDVTVPYSVSFIMSMTASIQLIHPREMDREKKKLIGIIVWSEVKLLSFEVSFYVECFEFGGLQILIRNRAKP